MSANTPGPLVSSAGCRACPGTFSAVRASFPMVLFTEDGGRQPFMSPRAITAAPPLELARGARVRAPEAPSLPRDQADAGWGPGPPFPAPALTTFWSPPQGLPPVQACLGRRMELPGPRGAGGLACSCAFASRPWSPHRSPGRGYHPLGQPSVWRLSSEGPALETSQKPQLSVCAGSPQALHPWQRPLGVVAWLEMFQGTGRGAGFSAGRAQAGPALRPDLPAPYRTRGRWANTMTGGLRGPAWGSDGSVCGESQLCDSGQRD